MVMKAKNNTIEVMKAVRINLLPLKYCLIELTSPNLRTEDRKSNRIRFKVLKDHQSNLSKNIDIFYNP
jgi:hypothetical protein